MPLGLAAAIIAGALFAVSPVMTIVKKGIMFKKFITLLFLVFTGFTAFAQEDYGENYTGSIGVGFNNLIDKERGYLGALGINFGGYTFFNHKYNVGLYTFTTLNFVLAGRGDYDSIFMYDQTLAAAFRYKFNNTIELLWAIGPHLSIFTMTYEQNPDGNISANGINVGIVGDLGLKLNSKDTKNYIILGINTGYDFFTSGGTAKNDGYHKKVTTDYYLVGIKPYIMIGSNARIFSGLLDGGKRKR
ncbi:MAG: hypothetical protein LBK66_05930 [Spirochaetaceae bacterium]|nr:hypothetical protein [Spirochaetaceae bacterium]